jgi:hypothetical protein
MKAKTNSVKALIRFHEDRLRVFPTIGSLVKQQTWRRPLYAGKVANTVMRNDDILAQSGIEVSARGSTSWIPELSQKSERA